MRRSASSAFVAASRPRASWSLTSSSALSWASLALLLRWRIHSTPNAAVSDTTPDMQAIRIAMSFDDIPRSQYGSLRRVPGLPPYASGEPGRCPSGVPARWLPGSAVGERPVIEVRLGQDLEFLVVLQHVDPRLAVALLEQDVLRAHDVAGVEVLRIGPRPYLHVLVLRAQRGDHHGRALVPHLRQQALDQVTDQVHAQGPAVPEVAERVGHVRHAADHDAAPGDVLGEVDRIAVDGERDVAEDREVEAGGRDHDVGRDLLTGADPDPVLGERLDGVGDDRGLSLAQRREQVAVRDDGDALLPRPVPRGEVLADVEALGQQRADRLHQERVHL